MTVLSPSVADLSSLEPDLQTPSSPTKPVCDYPTYMRLLAENADLQRTNGLLKLEAGKSGLGEAEKVEALQTELKILSANNKVSLGLLSYLAMSLCFAWNIYHYFTYRPIIPRPACSYRSV